jgi:hypothetical protein
MTAQLPMPSGNAPRLHAKGRFYMLLPVLLLGGSFVGWFFMIRAAVTDPSAAIEPDYYRQASEIDHEKAILARSEQLGWLLHLESFRIEPSGGAKIALRFEDRSRAPLVDLDVTVLAFPNTRSADRQKLTLTLGSDGLYTTEIARPRVGLWELRVVARKNGEEFHQTLRPELFTQGQKT